MVVKVQPSEEISSAQCPNGIKIHWEFISPGDISSQNTGVMEYFKMGLGRRGGAEALQPNNFQFQEWPKIAPCSNTRSKNASEYISANVMLKILWCWGQTIFHLLPWTLQTISKIIYFWRKVGFSFLGQLLPTLSKMKTEKICQDFQKRYLRKHCST